MGIIAKGTQCNIVDCNNDGIRSLNVMRIDGTSLKINTTGKKAVLCKLHYKHWKKDTKKTRSVERSRYDKLNFRHSI